MSNFYRSGHWRTNMYGTTYWVSGHRVSRDDWYGTSAANGAVANQPIASPAYVTSESYVNPNARCPLCGAPVYFYRSPTGGGVFFDDLGPPWPKHPCTSSWQPSVQDKLWSVRSQILTSNVQAKLRAPRNNWQPLIIKRIAQGRWFDLIFVDEKFSTLGEVVLPVPLFLLRGKPLFWRKYLDDPSRINISTVEIDSGKVNEKIYNVPAWVGLEIDLGDVSPDIAPSPEDWNSIGWAASFAWRSETDLEWPFSDVVDWEWAKLAFEKGAEACYWPSMNNLGVMYREGYGVKVNSSKAFEMFQKASQDLDPVPLRHLAACYRKGIGTSIDENEAVYLDELAALMEMEQENFL